MAAFGAASFVSIGVFVAASGCGSSSGSSGGATFAVINGESISIEDFHKYLESKSRVKVKTNDGQVVEAEVAESLAFQGLQDLIGRQIMFQLAKDEGVFPTDAEISKEVDYQQKLYPGFLTKMNQLGITMDRIKQDIRINLTREKLVTKGVTVTMAEAEDFIKQNPKRFMEPAKVSMLWVFVRTADKKAKVDQAIKSGQTFSLVAAQHSDFPLARQQSGRFVGPDGSSEREVQTLDPKLQEMVKNTPEGQLTPWLNLTDGSARFFIEKKVPEKPLEMNNYRKEKVRRDLALARGAQAIDLNKRVLDKLLASKIDVKERSLVDAWKNAFERFKQEQKVDVPGGTGEPNSTTKP